MLILQLALGLTTQFANNRTGKLGGCVKIVGGWGADLAKMYVLLVRLDKTTRHQTPLSY